MCTGSIGKKGRINVAPAIENMFPKLELIAIMMNFMMLPKARRGDPALEDAEVVSQQDDVGGVFGNVTAPSTEIPTSPVCSDGASLMPSPRKPTTWPRCFRPRMTRFV
jgi:hypothetical protein